MGLLPRRVVSAITLSRVLAALLLLLAGWYQRWDLAAILLLLGFFTDMLDGALARRWQVESLAGERLDSNASAVLSLCALFAALVGGAWPWWAFLLLPLWAGARWLEPRLAEGSTTLEVVRLGTPVANFLLLGGLEAAFVRHGWHVSDSWVLWGELLVALVLGWAKYERLREYVYYALGAEPYQDEDKEG